MINQFYVSADGGDTFTSEGYETREFAVDDVVKNPADFGLAPGQTFHTGKLVPPDMDSIVDPDIQAIFTDMQEKAAEGYGEPSEDWLSDVKPEQEQDLHDKIKGILLHWMLENKLTPGFGGIEEVEEHKVSNPSHN